MHINLKNLTLLNFYKFAIKKNVYLEHNEYINKDIYEH
jgi:hypothetical protein